MTEQEQTLKSAKDSLVSTLFELSKAAQETAKATINFYNIASKGETTEAFQSLVSSLNVIQTAANVIQTQGEATSTDGPAPKKRKRAKVEKDPFAPKKPLTQFFAYSAKEREQIRSSRASSELPPLSSIDMTQEISKRWNQLTAEEKEKWKKSYQTQLVDYQEKREKYLEEKGIKDEAVKDGEVADIKPVAPVAPVEPAAKPAKKKKSEDKEAKKEKTEKSVGEDEKKKEKKEKKEKKSKKRKASTTEEN